MDTLTIILLTVGLGALVALVWMSGYELGHASGSDAERALANQRINGILAGERRIDAVVAYENNRRPKARKNRVKASRKAVRA